MLNKPSSLMVFYFKAFAFLLVIWIPMLLDTAVGRERLLATHSRDLATSSDFYHCRVECPLTVDRHDHNIQDRETLQPLVVVKRQWRPCYQSEREKPPSPVPPGSSVDPHR